MSYYYKYNFVSPEPIYSLVKEELKSYFDTGAIDDLLFPTYLNKCLEKLGRATYVITEEVLHIENFKSRLPDNFYAVREAWMCAEIPLNSYQQANSFYSQTSSTTIQISPLTIGGQLCNNSECQNPKCPGDCMPEIIQAVYKTNNEIERAFRQVYLLKPGNISARDKCEVDYSSNLELYGQHNFSKNPNSSSYDSFDIRDNQFVTNFRNGVVHLIFYANNQDNCGNQLIPDNYRIKEYIEAFIKYKVFETLFNQINDETYKQIESKMIMYKQMSDEAYILAESEIKKQDVYTKQRRIIAQKNRNNMYNCNVKLNRSRFRRSN